MRIICDMDNTICKTHEYFLYNCKIRYHKNELKYTEDTSSGYHITDWFVKNNYASSLVEAAAMKEIIFNDENYWATIPPMDNAVEVITKLSNKHEIFIASDALTVHNESCMIGKKRWLKRFLPVFNYSQLIFIHNKSMLSGNLLIEDVGEQIKGFNGKTMLFDYPYNKDFRSDYRVWNWKQAEEIIGDLSA